LQTGLCSFVQAGFFVPQFLIDILLVGLCPTLTNVVPSGLSRLIMPLENFSYFAV
jgi:hypothetical protein